MAWPGLVVNIFWLASPIVQMVIAAFMFRRRLHREFPFFFAYTVFRSTTALFIFMLYQTHFLVVPRYGYALSLHEAGCIILRFAVIYELFTVVFKPYLALRSIASSVLRWGTVLLLAVSVIVAINQQFGPYANALGMGLNLLDRTADTIQCGLLVTLLLLSGYLRISWKRYVFGVAMGLGVFAAVDLSAAAVEMELSSFPLSKQVQVTNIVNLVSMIAYFVCTLIWLTYTLVPEPVPQFAPVLPENDLDSWDKELQRLVHR